MGAEIPADSLGDEFKGYIFKIKGGNDKQGFPMMQGVMTTNRVRLLFREGMKCFRPRREGQLKRKSVRGCIASPALSVLQVAITQKGDQEIPGLTDGSVPRRLGPKRANNIRKMWGLSKDDDVRKYVVKRAVTDKHGKVHWKTPKIQRLITASRLQRKRRRLAVKRQRREKSAALKADYEKLIASVKESATSPKKKVIRPQSEKVVFTSPMH